MVPTKKLASTSQGFRLRLWLPCNASWLERIIGLAHGMDLTTTIAELRREKEPLSRVIAALAGCGKTPIRRVTDERL